MIILLILVVLLLWRDRNAMPELEAVLHKGPITLFDRAPAPDRTRLRILAGSILGAYAISVVALYFFWYKKSKLSDFHWFDDRGEWNQMDKAGHIFGGYFQTVWGYEVTRWAGLSNRQAAIVGAVLGLSIQSSIEVMDGFSSKWGASRSDLGANFTGAFIACSQYLMWEEQRIMLKYSPDPGSYTNGELNERAGELFGTGTFDKGLKDYNHMTLWASINPSKFHAGMFPKWFCFAVGYSSENLYGGFQNVWEDKDGYMHDRSDLQRLRVINLSLDADLPQLSKGNKKELAALKFLNIFKVWFPRAQYKWEAGKATNPNPNGWGRED